MSLRTRETRMVRGIVDNENKNVINKGKTTTVSNIPKRAALAEVAANTNVLNQPKENTKKDEKSVPIALKTKKAIKPNVQTLPKPQAKQTAVVKPNGTGRTLGLKKKDDIPVPACNPVERPVAIIQPCQPCACDIDKDDVGKLFLVPEYTNEIYQYLRYLETQYPVREKYLTGQLITSTMRSTLVDWLVEVQLTYHLFPETLHLCIGIMDMFLQKVTTMTRDRLQLVGVSAMLVACKYEETYPPDITDFVYITDNSFTKEHIIGMEKYICKKLGFRFGRPLSLHFLRRYSKAAFATPLQHSISKYLLELALVDYRMVHVRPSMIAALACYLALTVTSTKQEEPGKPLWTNTLVKYSTYSYKDFKHLVPAMASVIVKSKSSKLRAIPNKYASVKFLEVSTLPCLESEELKKLADLS